MAVWLALSGCLSPFATHERDAAAPDAPIADAAVRDASRMPRPDWLPPLTPACGSRVADVEDPSSYDTHVELARALSEAECQWGVRCDDELAALACDPLGLLPGRYRPDFRAADAERCLRAWVERTCSQDTSEAEALYAVCAPLFGAGRRNGEPCTASDECAFACENPTGETCAGTCRYEPWPCEASGCPPGDRCSVVGCVTVVGEGAACDGLHVCDDGLLCNDARRCATYPGEGDPCYRFDGPVTVILCGGDLLCDLDTRCRPRRDVGLGEPCGGAAICADEGAFCSLLDARCHVPGAEGDTCDYWGALSHGAAPRCLPGLHCEESETEPHGGTCVANHAPGEPCDPGDTCEGDYACLTIDLNGREPGSRCGHVGAPGCACGEATVCPRDFECHEGTCQRRGTFPHACTRDDDCIPYLGSCSGGTCVTRIVGDECGGTRFCFEGYCSESRAGAPPGECLPFRLEGEPCDRLHECGHPSTCVGGTCRGPEWPAVCPAP